MTILFTITAGLHWAIVPRENLSIKPVHKRYEVRLVKDYPLEVYTAILINVVGF